MRLWIVLSLVLGAATFVGGARTEDGDPTPVSKPSPCLNKTLTGGENYGGTNISDCVTGGTGANAIGLYGGKDWADGRGGSDSIYGGDLQDVLFGGNEGDHIEGQSGNDFIRAGCPGGCDQTGANYFNELFGNAGDDSIAACNGVHDVLNGGGDFDTGYVDANKDDWSGFERIVTC